jgi:large subunit ribosomal protein L1
MKTQKLTTKKRGKRYREAAKHINSFQAYDLQEAVDLVQKTSYARFDATVNVAFRLGVDPRHADQLVRGVLALPQGSGKTLKVAVIASEAKQAEAREAGADVVGGEDVIAAIQAGDISCDRYIATPDMMGKVGAVARILGPKGLMPNPKLGTVTLAVGDAVKAAKSGTIEYRCDKYGIVHGIVGRVSFSPERIIENVKAFAEALQKAKPQGARGTYFLSLDMHATMGPAVRVVLSSALSA